jgi:hypothetical protein
MATRDRDTLLNVSTQPGWRQRLEQHLRRELDDAQHPRYARRADGSLHCPECGALSAPAESTP